jgi:uncharacterized protein (TIGR03437 family)
MTVPVSPTAPGIFTADGSGAGQAAALNQDNTGNGPGNAAAVGAVLVIYGTGEGQTNPAGVDGQMASSLPFPRPLASVQVTIGGVPAVVEYAGGAPGMVAGALQLNVRVGQGTPSGNQALVLTIGGVQSQPGVTVAIR